MTARLYTRLRGTAHQDAVAAVAAACLEAAEPRTRARALDFAARMHPPVVLQRVLGLLRGDRAGFAGVPDEVTTIESDTTLEDSLWRAARPLIEKLESARELARTEVLAEGRGRAVLYDRLAMEDPDWFVAHAGDMARATPEREEQLVRAIDKLLPVPVPQAKEARAAVPAARPRGNN